jgi:hypothetical protein
MKLYLMLLGLLQPLGVPVPGYLIQTEDRANILIDTGFPRRFIEDEAKTRASTRKLVEVIRREAVTLIFHGHDHKQWPTLKHAPQYYD